MRFWKDGQAYCRITAKLKKLVPTILYLMEPAMSNTRLRDRKRSSRRLCSMITVDRGRISSFDHAKGHSFGRNTIIGDLRYRKADDSKCECCVAKLEKETMEWLLRPRQKAQNGPS